MNYTLRIAGKDIPVQADLTDDGALDAVIDGRNISGRYCVISENQIHLEIGGKAMNAFISEDHEGKLVNVHGITFLVQDADALELSGPRRRGLKELPQEVTPPMPSVVVRILVALGDMVAKGQGVVVVTAMKMETTLQAPFAGVIRKIGCSEGEKVMPGQILIDIEKAEEGGEE